MISVYDVVVDTRWHVIIRLLNMSCIRPSSTQQLTGRMLSEFRPYTLSYLREASVIEQTCYIKLCG